MSSVFGMIYNELDAMRVHGKEEFTNFSEAFDALDTEQVMDIILDGNTYWFEMSMYGEVSQDAHKQLQEYISRKGWKYLYSQGK